MFSLSTHRIPYEISNPPETKVGPVEKKREAGAQATSEWYTGVPGTVSSDGVIENTVFPVDNSLTLVR